MNVHNIKKKPEKQKQYQSLYNLTPNRQNYSYNEYVTHLCP